MIFLPDTNTFSRLLRGPADGLRDQFKAHSSSICMSVIVEAELRYSLAKKQLERSNFGKLVRQMIESFVVLRWTSATAQTFADLRSQSERQGITIATADMMIATQAKEMGYVLVTNDRALHQLSHWIAINDWTD